MKIENDLTKVVGIENIFFYEDMKKHTTIKIGGKARIFITPNSTQQIVKIVEICNKFKMDYCVIGSGSKLLVLDGGINKVVICLTNKFSGIKKISETQLEVLSGTSLNRLNKYCLSSSLGGLEETFLIPATVGGAIHNNAGAYSTSIGDCVESVTVLEDNKIKEISKNDCCFAYRTSIFYNKPHCIILSVKFNLYKKDRNLIKEKFVQILNSRTASQPLDKKTFGSVFKRDNNIIPSKIIDDLGLKGFKIGGAIISQKHAGFIENTGNATAKDVLKLIDFISKKVYNNYKTTLTPEIIVMGEDTE